MHPLSLKVMTWSWGLFGAVTFQRMPKFYKQDNATYNCVVQH